MPGGLRGWISPPTGSIGSRFASGWVSTVTYRLAPAPLSADTLAELPQPLSLDRVTVPAALDTDRIRVTRGHQRLDHYAHARWAAPLPDVLSDALARLL